MRSARLLAIALLAGGALVARAADAPHEDGGPLCSNCHVGHHAPGASLTNVPGNSNLCASCHDHSDNFGFPWTDAIQAVPGVSGRSHRWDADASAMGATPPSAGSADADEREMESRLDGGKLMCSTCHDVHDADFQPESGRGRQTVSAVTKAGAGTGQVTVTGPVASGAPARGYRIAVVSAGSETEALYRLSNDNGKSWFGCEPGTHTYVAWSDASPNGCLAGGSVALNDGTNVAFAAGSYAVADSFDFYVSYPFLRADATNSKMCLTCHRDRNMTAANVRGAGPHAGTGAPIVPGTTVFHHPVGGVLAGAPLDASGDAQTPGDGNPSNDLVLGSGVVSCLTCHRVHNADSNSLSPDP